MVLSKTIFSPQTFLEIVTGNCYLCNADNDIEFIHNILIQEGYEDDDSCTVWDYPLDEIDEIVENQCDVVLVECCYFDDNDILQKEYRWFEVPDGSQNGFKEDWCVED